MFTSQSEPVLILQTADFAIFAKPPGMETVSRDGGPELTALVRASRNEPGLEPVHRLDRDTSGAQLFARTPAAERELTGLFRHRLVEKTYLVFCFGVPRNRQGVINRRLSEWEGGRRPVRVVKKGGLEASTGYEVMAASGERPEGWRAGLLAMHPHQGRTHQIRVHAASLGYPILGDDQYGDRRINAEAKRAFGLRRQALHAWRLAFPWEGGRVEATCPLPEDLLTLSRGLFGRDDW